MFTIIYLLVLSGLHNPIKVDFSYKCSKDDTQVSILCSMRDGYSIIAPTTANCPTDIEVYIDGRRLPSDAMKINGDSMYYKDDHLIYLRKLNISFNFMSPHKKNNIRVEIYPYINGVMFGKQIHNFKVIRYEKAGRVKGLSQRYT